MIGVFGGTFDPIHYGHLRAALDVHQALGFRELRFMPLNVAVHREQPLANATQRCAMVEAAVAGERGFRMDDRELTRAGRSFTVDTLISLRRELGSKRPICLLVGGDAFNGFFNWHRPRDILELAHLVVMQRPGVSIQRDPRLSAEVARRRATVSDALERTAAGRIWFEAVTQLDISSTGIRHMLAQGRSPRYLLPDAVLEIACGCGCYTARPTPERQDSATRSQKQLRGRSASQ
ncbi:MAG: nicotinate-nucleotide adenylyltransferase [Thiohalocapsa sp.]